MRLLISPTAIWFALGCTAYLHFDVEQRAPPKGHRLRTRDSAAEYVDLPLPQSPNHWIYMINISIGTPPQPLRVQFDTGSSDLWVPAPNNPQCTEGNCHDGSYTSTLSESYDLVKEGGFLIQYFSEGDFAAGDWVNDTVTFLDGSSITQQLFGVAYDGPNALGVMGLGFTTGGPGTLPGYGAPGTVLESLAAQHIIGRQSFSLYLNDFEAAAGSLLLGGVDTTKYTGDLVTLPIQGDETGQQYSYAVALTSLSITDSSGETTQLTPTNYSAALILDSGTPDVWIDQDTFNRLALGFGAVITESGYFVPCSLAPLSGTLNYRLGGDDGITIRVPLSHISTGQAYDNTQFADDAGSGGCYLNFNPASSTLGMLGDTFLRSAYVVHDVDNMLIAIAQAAPDQGHTSNIIAMGADETIIPGATRTGAARAVYDYSSTEYTLPAALIAQIKDGVMQPGTPTFNLGMAAASSTKAGNDAVHVRSAYRGLSLTGTGLTLAMLALS